MDSPVFRNILIVFGLVLVFVVGWMLESNYAPIISHYWTPDSASAIDKHLLEGARHVAPLKYRKWLEEQAALRADETLAPCAQADNASYDDYASPDQSYFQPAPVAAHGRTVCDDGRQRMLVNR